MRPILIGLALLGLGFTPALVGATLAAPPAHAGKGGDSQGGKPEKEDRGDRDDKGGLTAERVLTAIERAILRDYFGTGETAGHKGLPPGLAKRDTLPPGLEKQLERNGRLPPGLEGRALPDDLERRLPRRDGTRRVVVGDDVVLIEEGTRVILDILRGAAGGR
ncbi:hypothetical protein ACM64Y_04985 [Novispirillum sp. DQ9]|uniref:hypothetical protein n=1 Tax=Novispirillum sp. DQ9 TaxID=3398612 RepID=UPI003C7C1C69